MGFHNNLIWRNRISVFIKLMLAYFVTVSVTRYLFSGSNIVFGTALNGILFFVSFVLIDKAQAQPPRAKRLSGIFAAFYAVVTVIGKSLYDNGNLDRLFQSPKQILSGLISVIGLTVLVGAFASLVLAVYEKHDTVSPNGKMLLYTCSDSSLFFILWAGIFLLYIPCFLAYYPGIYSYDILYQNMQAMGVCAYSKYHPPLHTFFWQLCMGIGRFLHIESLVVYGILQMLMLAATFAYALVYIRRRQTKNSLFTISALYFALNPVFAIFSIIPTKDVCFSVFFVLSFLFIYDAVRYSEEFFRNRLKFAATIVTLVLCCLLRNNAIYVFVATALCLILFLKKYRLQTYVLFLCALASFFIINGPVMRMLRVEDGNNREKLSVPMQQIAYTVVRHAEELSEETVLEIDRFLNYDTILSDYNPRFADPIKYGFKTGNYNSDPMAFYKLWFRLLCRYPGEYVTAFLNLNLPYWYPDASTMDEYSQRQYIETYIYEDENYSVVRDSKLPGLYRFYESVADYSLFQKLPLISNLFSITTPVWAILCSAFCLIWKRRYRALIILLSPFLLWATYMLGPVSNMRYILPITMLYPLFLLLIFDGGGKRVPHESQTSKETQRDFSGVVL